MSINRRSMLAGLSTVPATAVASNLAANNLDASLFQLEAEFNAAAEQYQAASDRLQFLQNTARDLGGHAS